MVARESYKLAAERIVNGVLYGTFTNSILVYLNQNRRSELIVSYRTLRDQITNRVTRQTLRVFGRDTLIFFGDKEPFSATPIVVRLKQEGKRIYFPVGEVYGIQEGSEFTTFPPTLYATFSVDKINDFECSAPVPLEVFHEQVVQKYNYQIVFCRWSLGGDVLRVVVQPSFGSEFQQAFYAVF